MFTSMGTISSNGIRWGRFDDPWRTAFGVKLRPLALAALVSIWLGVVAPERVALLALRSGR